ncbi:MAG: cupin domain-containing protein [Gammaproteobacteria bacterium]
MSELDASRSILVHSVPGRRSGISPDTIPGSKIAMHVFTVAPGETIVPGNELEAESAAYLVSGRAQILTGGDFTKATDVAAGDFYFTPMRLPHRIRNPGDEPAQVVFAWSLDRTMTNASGKQKAAQDDPRVHVVHKPLEASATAQTRGMRRVPAICAETTGATQIWMCFLTVEPHERGQPHHHGRTHTAAYTISGRARICFGRNFEEFIEPRAGDFAFDPPGLVHLVDHPFDDEPWKGVLARCPENTVVNFGD